LKIKKFNCSPKLAAPVEIPTREQVREVCLDIKQQVVDRVFPINDVVDLVGHFIARRFRVNVMHAQAWEVEPTELNLNAFYDPDRDERKKISIELVLVTNPNDKHLILDQGGWDLFVNRLADTLAHELIHMRQSRSRDFLEIEQSLNRRTVVDENLAYLSNPDEIDAYAYNIATELKEHPNPLQKILNPKTVRVSDSINLWAYVNAFAQNISDPILQRLLKKIYKHLTAR
jgi:hypothetical protein